MKTIRSKLFLFFMVCTAAFAAMSVLLNVLFLENFYIYRNKTIFTDTARDIAQAFSRDPAGIGDTIKTIDRTRGISVIIAAGDGTVRYTSFSAGGQEPLKLPSELESVLKSNAADLARGYVYTIADTPGSSVRQITLAQNMKSGDILILRKPVTWVLESAAIANEFLLYTGLLIVAAGGIVIYLLAKRVTGPVVRMNEAARGMAALDFSKRIDVRSRDEIGELGQNINHIAEKLSVSLAELRQDVERRKLLVRNLSHELKTPIGVIKGYAEGLRYGIADDKEEFEKYCGVITAECDRMDRMVRELLNLSRMESGTFEVHKQRIDVRELLETLSERFSPDLAQAGAHLSVLCDPGVAITADRDLMERLVTNLLSNAIHHADGPKLVRAEAAIQHGTLALSIFNTGKPIPEEDLARVWDVFFMSDKARSPRYGGHGLGLSIVSSIAELHGGMCGCENLPGGVRFFVKIPS